MRQKCYLVDNTRIFFALNQREGKCLFPRMSVNASDDSAEILIYDVLVSEKWFEDEPGLTLNEIIDEIRSISAKNITMRINSVGGDVSTAVAARQWLREHPANVTVKVDGLAASSAATLATAGDNVLIARGGQFMIHKPMTATFGDDIEHQRSIDMLQSAQGGIADIYAAHTGKSVEDINDMMNAETWFNAQEAVEVGFAEAILDDHTADNLAVPKGQFKNLPNNVTEAEWVEFERFEPKTDDLDGQMALPFDLELEEDLLAARK